MTGAAMVGADGDAAADNVSDVVRPGLRAIRLTEGRSRLTGAVWVHASEMAGREATFVDPVVNVSPSAEGALEAAPPWARVAGAAAKVAFVSSSTMGSGADPCAGLMTEAVERLRDAAPHVAAAGPIQADVALSEAAARTKASGPIAGDATVLAFPNLMVATIAVKLAEHLGGARPCNELSRACRVEDVVATAAITVLQAERAQTFNQETMR